MKNFLVSLMVFQVLAGGAPAAEAIVNDEELKEVAELVELARSRHKAGAANMNEVFAAERFYLKAQFWGGKISREDFVQKADGLHKKAIANLRAQIANGTANQTALLQAYQLMFEDRRIQ